MFHQSGGGQILHSSGRDLVFRAARASANTLGLMHKYKYTIYASANTLGLIHKCKYTIYTIANTLGLIHKGKYTICKSANTFGLIQMRKYTPQFTIHKCTYTKQLQGTMQQ